MESIRSIEDIFSFFTREQSQVLAELQQWGLVRSTLRCPSRRCRRHCVQRIRSSAVLGHNFVCRMCKRHYSILKGSFFEKMRLPVRKVMYLLYFWSCLTPAGITARLMNLRLSTVCQHYRFIRDVVSWKLLQVPEMFKLGGVGHVVQIDESVVTKRKYNVGRVVPQVWILGMVDTTTKKGMILYIENRSRQAIIKCILKHVLPGTEIWTDKWRAYDTLSLLDGVSPYIHKSVNHSNNFVDPETGVHTNYIEGYWSRLKKFCRTKNVLQSKLLPEHIDHFMWYELYGKNDTFVHIIQHICEKYTF
ncbi:hypothetical protein RN001_000180 [Aquatica leii]|uniref:ISXO2-like transposase domain-containing protein n=1 Tax=Aquatica leii TaxID=1421715 RepID=A0AAN7Q2P8_9COLE|nr:hypothetical protein RN001_000180 [Aquatica leii]